MQQFTSALVGPALTLALAACSHSTPVVTAATVEGPAVSSPIDLTTPTGVLHGTLLLPGGKAPHPVALLLSGSGSTDRDGNSSMLAGPNNSLLMFAEGLAAKGIASVRYDKRGIAQSRAAGKSEAALRFDDYVKDAAGWIARLRADHRFGSITVIGHSEGSLVGMIAAQQAHADRFASLEGAGRPAGTVLREQLKPQLPPALWHASERILAGLETGATSDSVPPPLAALYRPSVQPYLISWLKYDPATELSRLEIPVMIVQGSTDIQVGLADAERLHTAAPLGDYLLVAGMNHILKAVSDNRAEQIASYSDSLLPVVPEPIDRVAGFILGR